MRQTKPKILNAQFIFWQRFNMPFFISKTFPVTDVYYVIVCRCDISYILWRRGVVVITTAQLHSSKSELRFCAGSNPARCVSEIRDGEDLWQWSRLEMRLNGFRRSTIPQKQFIIIIYLKPYTGDHTFMTSTRKGDGGVLTFVTCLRILLFLSNRSIVHFCGW